MFGFYLFPPQVEARGVGAGTLSVLFSLHLAVSDIQQVLNKYLLNE